MWGKIDRQQDNPELEALSGPCFRLVLDVSLPASPLTWHPGNFLPEGRSCRRLTPLSLTTAAMMLPPNSCFYSGS